MKQVQMYIYEKNNEKYFRNEISENFNDKTHTREPLIWNWTVKIPQPTIHTEAGERQVSMID